MIDGHEQFNGSIWQFYLKLQPGMICSTKDHSKCKALSIVYQAKLDQEAADQAAADKIKADEKAAEDKAAADKLAADQADQAAAVAKLQAINARNDQYRQASESLASAHNFAVTEINADHDSAISVELAAYEKKQADLLASLQADIKALNSKDWKAKAQNA